MQITQKTDQWGNSTGIRLPKKVIKAAKWQQEQEVRIDVHGRKVVLTPVGKEDKKLTLKEMLKGVTPDMVHYDDINWGPDVGREIIDDDY